MNKKRLTILRDALIEYAKQPGNLKFDLERWVGVPSAYEGKEDVAVAGALKGENYCGTAACAMGLATTIPAFRRAGLDLECVSGYAACPVFGEDAGMGAAASFFDIDYDDADELFYPSCYSRTERLNPLAVADKITALLESA